MSDSHPESLPASTLGLFRERACAVGLFGVVGTLGLMGKGTGLPFVLEVLMLPFVPAEACGSSCDLTSIALADRFSLEVLTASACATGLLLGICWLFGRRGSGLLIVPPPASTFCRIISSSIRVISSTPWVRLIGLGGLPPARPSMRASGLAGLSLLTLCEIDVTLDSELGGVLTLLRRPSG